MKTKKVKLFDITKLRFSIELEVEFPNSKNSEALIGRHKVLTGWEIDSDGSLDNGAEYRPKNSNKLYWNKETQTQLKEILALIRVHRGKTKHTAGLHIHINCKKFTDKQIHTIITEFVHKQRYIIKRFRVHEERLKYTCQLLPKALLKKLKVEQISDFREGTQTTWESLGCQYLDQKHYSLNAKHLCKGGYGTLEFRLFNSTLNYKKLYEQILWVLTFIKESIERE